MRSTEREDDARYRSASFAHASHLPPSGPIDDQGLVADHVETLLDAICVLRIRGDAQAALRQPGRRMGCRTEGLHEAIIRYQCDGSE